MVLLFPFDKKYSMKVIKMDTTNMTEQQFIEWYQANEKGKYETPSMTTDMIIFTNQHEKLQLLLIQRKQHPFKQSWAFPGGFVDMDEDLDTAALRELQEETGLQQIYATQLYTWSDVNRDPRMRVISASYLALVNREALLAAKAADDAADVALFTIELPVVKKYVGTQRIMLRLSHPQKGTLSAELDITYTQVGKQLHEKINIVEQQNIAFDHAKAIVYAILRMRERAQNSPLALELLPETFSFEQLKQAYEAIMNEQLAKSTILQYVEKINKDMYQFKQV